MKYIKFLLFTFLLLELGITRARVIDSVEVVYYRSVSEFGGYARRIKLIIENGKSFCSFDEFNFNNAPVIGGKVLSQLSISEHWSFYTNQSYQNIAHQLDITDQEKHAFLKILEKIEATKASDKSETIVSNAWDDYLIRRGKDSIVFVKDFSQQQWGKEMENALDINNKAFFIRMRLTNTPSLYSLDGLKMPYEVIRHILVNEDIIDFSFDRSFNENHFSGLYHLNTKLFVVLDGKMLTSKLQKKKYLSGLDFKYLEISLLRGKEVRTRYCKKVKKDILIISRL